MRSAQWDQCIMPFGGIVEHCPPRSDKRIVCSSWSRQRKGAGWQRQRQRGNGNAATATRQRQRGNGNETTATMAEEGRTSISIDCRVSPRAREAPSEYYSAVVESHHVVAARDLAERRQHRRGVERAGCCIDAAWRSAGREGRKEGRKEGAVVISNRRCVVRHGGSDVLLGFRQGVITCSGHRRCHTRGTKKQDGRSGAPSEAAGPIDQRPRRFAKVASSSSSSQRRGEAAVR